jgi:hypothetical protein
MDRYYEIKAEINTFNAIVSEYEFEYRVKFGGTRECINISVYKDDDEANINGISYDQRCSKDESMIPGKETIEMVKCSLKFTRELFPQLTKNFLFKDHSKITCLKNIKISLYYYYLTKYGRTWYQKNFNAKPIRKESTKKINDALDVLKEQTKKIQFKDFSNKYFRGCKINNLEAAFEEIYQNSLTYKDFLTNIIDNYDCGILDTWFALFWSEICLFNFNEEFWMINGKEVDKWSVVSISSKQEKPKFRRIPQEGGFFPFGKKPGQKI